MKSIRILGLAMLCLLFVSTAFAGVTGSVQLDGSYVNYNFVDTDGNQQEEGVSPYGAALTYNGLPAYGYVTCLDLGNPTYIGQNYTGTWTGPSTFAEQEASWLSDQLYGLNPATADPDYVGPIAMAIWTVMFPSSTNTEGLTGVPVDPAALTWLDQAAAAVNNGYVADNIMFLPDDPSSQRFMLNPPAPIPEPGTLALMGSSIVGLGAASFNNYEKYSWTRRIDRRAFF